MTVTSIVFPGSPFGSPQHYVLWGKGDQTLTSRLFTPVLIDANSGKLAAVVKMPWYLRALEISRPLHFGDYGGLPLKILWAMLDVITIGVLCSGLYALQRTLSVGRSAQDAYGTLGQDRGRTRPISHDADALMTCLHSAHSFWRTWSVPATLAALTLFGLLSALLGERDIWKVFAWIGLGIPVAMTGWFSLRRSHL